MFVSTEHIGNILFRIEVQKLYGSYHNCHSSDLIRHKNALARKVVSIVTRRGGRFLQKISKHSHRKTLSVTTQEDDEGSYETTTKKTLQSFKTNQADTMDLYIVVGLRRAMEKTKQCFRHYSNKGHSSIFQNENSKGYDVKQAGHLQSPHAKPMRIFGTTDVDKQKRPVSSLEIIYVDGHNLRSCHSDWDGRYDIKQKWNLDELNPELIPPSPAFHRSYSGGELDWERRLSSQGISAMDNSCQDSSWQHSNIAAAGIHLKRGHILKQPQRSEGDLIARLQDTFHSITRHGNNELVSTDLLHKKIAAGGPTFFGTIQPSALLSSNALESSPLTRMESMANFMTSAPDSALRSVYNIPLDPYQSTGTKPFYRDNFY